MDLIKMSEEEKKIAAQKIQMGCSVPRGKISNYQSYHQVVIRKDGLYTEMLVLYNKRQKTATEAIRFLGL